MAKQNSENSSISWGEALQHDLPASIIVFLVALPLCIGIAQASGATPTQGLVTGIVGGLVVALFAGAPLQVSGPAAGLFVLVYEAIEKHGIAALGPIVLLAGLVQLVAGLWKCGGWFRAVSPAVIQGMLSGIGVLILAQQFHVMVDDHDAAKPWLDQGLSKGIANLITIPQSLWLGVTPLDNSPHHLAALVGVGTIVILALWKSIPWATLRVVPAPVVAVVLASVVVQVMNWPITLVQAPADFWADLQSNLPTIAAFDGFEFDEYKGLIISALTIALVASAETMLCATAVDQMQQHTRTNYNRELTAQGIGNMVCGALGALPMTGVIVRSSANVDAGGRTRLSAWFHGLWLLLFVAALPWVLNYIPTASLAAVLVFTGWKLINVGAIRKLFSVSPMEGTICLITLGLVVGVDLLTGVVVGIVCAAIRLLYTFARFDVRVEEEHVSDRIDLRLRGAATFLALPRLAEVLDQIPDETELHVHLERLTYIDHACLEQFVNWEKRHAASGGVLVMDWEGLTAKFQDKGRSSVEDTHN